MSVGGPTVEIMTETRDGAVADARDVRLADLDFTVVDVETTGWAPDDAGITEIGAVRVHDGRVVAEFGSLVNPGRPVPGTVRSALLNVHERGGRLVSICSGAFALAATGLLAGRTAATHWMHADALARAYPRVRVDPDVLYVDDDRVLTDLARQVGLALHNSQLDTALQTTSDEVRKQADALRESRFLAARYPQTQQPQEER